MKYDVYLFEDSNVLKNKFGLSYRMTILQNPLRAYSLPYGRHIRSERATHEP